MQWNEFRSHIGYLSARQQQRVHDAFELGKKMHRGQLRKSGEPYFSHPIAVADMLADMLADADTIIAALLHDTVEDTSLTVREIETAFNGSVGTLIEGVTKLSATDVADQPNLNGQIETLRKMFTLMETDVRIMVIKLVDRLHNMQTAEFLPPEKRRVLAQETLDVYVKIADRLCMQDIRNELEGLSLSILEPDLFAKLSELRTQNELRGEEAMTAIRQNIGEVHAEFEPKTWGKLRKQLQMEGTTVTGVAAITIVFVCEDVDACYRTLGLLHQLWKREVMSFQDFINTPAINGYRGLHTTILLEDGTRVRCKLRTAEMHAYARKGIALGCFKGKRSGLLESLPWAERISPLAQDTEGRSGEFWQSLQSDILGESIVIYGPADQSVIVPKGSTALDGAFFLFKEDALKVRSISIGGKSVHFAVPLQHSVSLNVVLHEGATVDLQWLEWVKTGFAVAHIRTALSAGKTEAEKISLGKDLFQRTLSEHRRGFIEEFDENSLRKGLLTIGYPRLESLYMAIADGRIEPSEAYEALFGSTRKPASELGQSFRLSYTMDMANTEMMDRLNDVHRTYRRGLSDIHYKRGTSPQASVMIHGHLTPQELRTFTSALSANGVTDVRIASSYATAGHVFGVMLLVALWGLDPVVAGWLLKHSISSTDLTIIRFLTFWAIAAAAYGIQWFFASQKFKPINPLHPDLMLSGFALFCTALATYLALSRIGPTQYIIFIIGGVVLYALLRQRRMRWISLVATLVLGIVLVTLSTLQGWSRIGFLSAVVSSAAFVLYSNLSKRYQEEKVFILARYPAYLFWIASIGMLCSLPLLFTTTIGNLPFSMVSMATLFSALFTTLPYILYFELMRRVEVTLLHYALPFVFITTMIGEAVLSRMVTPFVALPLFPLFLWMYITMQGAPRREPA